MSHAQKNNLDNENKWRPSASLDVLRIRAHILATIREFFAARNVLEVETPVMCHTSVTDPFIHSIPTIFKAHPNTPDQFYYLQTSPEYAMKRLLAAGSGAIYQITKAFRQGEVGRIHNPEFTMLEWYQPDYDHHALMNEMDELLQLIFKTPPAERKTYGELFHSFLNINPHTVTVAELKLCAEQNNISLADNTITDQTTWLDILMSNCIEPHLGAEKPCFIYDYPIAQAALARIQTGETPVASRFEVYFHGMELANGFHELQDATEQRKRFEKNLIVRNELGLNPLPIDEDFLAALTHGLPDCAGVALGIDRLVMLATQSNKIADVLSFDFERVGSEPRI